MGTVESLRVPKTPLGSTDPKTQIGAFYSMQSSLGLVKPPFEAGSASGIIAATISPIPV